MSRLSHSVFLTATIDSLVALGLAVGSVMCAGLYGVLGDTLRDAPGGAGSIGAPHLALGAVAQFLLIRMTLLNASFSIVFVMLCRQCFSSLGLYRRDAELLRHLMMRTAAACAIAAALLAGYLEARHARGPICLIVSSFLIALFTCETARVLVLHRDRWHIGRPEQVIIIGSGRRAGKAWRELRLHQRHTKRVAGFVDDRPFALMAPDIASRFLGTIEDLPEFLRNNTVDELIVASPIRSCYDVVQRAVSIAQAAGVRVVCMNDVFTLAPDDRLPGEGPLFVELLAKRQRHSDPRHDGAPERLENARAKEALLKRLAAVS